MVLSSWTLRGFRGISVLIILIALTAGWLAQPVRAAPPVPVPTGGVLAVSTGQASSVVYAMVTVTQSRWSGHLVVYTCGTARPGTSSLNYAAWTNASVTTAVKTDAAGQFCIYASTATHVVVDFAGIDPARPATAQARLVDTRSASGPTAGRMFSAGQVVEFAAGAPNSVVFGTLTTVAPATSGYMVLFTCGTPMPFVSSAAFTPGYTRATLTMARTDARGRLCLFASKQTHAVFDRIKATTSAGTVTPVRLVDTRATGVVPAAGTIVRIPVSLPANYTVWGTLTTVGGSTTGHTTAFGCGSPLPPTSATQIAPGQALTQLVGVRTDASGAICVRVSAGTHVVFDQFGLAIVTGTPNVRIMDTRTLAVPRHPGTGKEFYPSVARWADNAANALAYQGLTVDYLPGVLAQVQQESSGIPTVVNNWDSNWQRGIASFGLLQTIYPTFNYYAPPECKGPDVGTVVKGKRQAYHPNMTNPDCNLRAGLAYVKSRYGTPRLDLWNRGINNAY